MNGSSRTTIVGILVLAGRRLSAAQLIRLAAPLGLSATNVKSHLTRMVAEGALEKEGPARLATYCPTADQLLVIDGIQARLKKTPQEPWDRTWLILALRFPQHRGQRETLRASLWFDGWRPVSPEVFVRPSWPRAWSQDSAQHYAKQALGFCFRGVFIGTPVEFGALYDLQGLDSEARRLAAWIRRRSTSARSPQAAFVERLRVGGHIAQLIGHDPRLPPAIWGKKRGMQELVDAFRRFEECIAPEAQDFLDLKIDSRPAVPVGPRRKP
jgi:DNA-binding transcriptional regulator PaaX